MLLHCPFCGGEAAAEVIEISGMRSCHLVRCTDCGATTWPWVIGADLAERAWNRRDGVVHCRECALDGTVSCPLTIVEKRQLVFVGRAADYFCADGIRKEG